MPHTVRTLPARLSAALLATLLACGGEATPPTPPAPTPPPPPPAPAAVASVVLSPSTRTLVPQQTEPLTATVRDAQGNVLSGRAITWTTDAPALASVSTDGRVSAVAVGTARISATSEGQSGSAVITVVRGAQIGANGGTLTFDNGAVTVDIPPGAVTGPTVITLERVSAPATTVPAGWQRLGPVWALGPAGVTFAQPVTITLAYDPADLPAFAMSGDLGVLASSSGSERQLSNVQVNPTTRRVSARTTTIGSGAFAHATTNTGSTSDQTGPSGDELSLVVQDPVVSLTPSVASVNSSHRYASVSVTMAPRGDGLPLPGDSPPLRYRWRSTRVHGSLGLDAPPPDAWTETTTVEYVATNPVLNEVRGEIDRVLVDVLLNPASLTDTSAGPPRIVTAEAVINADLELAYDITPSRDTLSPGAASTFRVRIRDQQGQERAFRPELTARWETSGFHGQLRDSVGAQNDYVALNQFVHPAPRVDRVVAVVTERVRREHVLRGRRAFIDPLTGQPRVIYEAADLVTIEERARDTAFVTVGVETWVGTVSLTTTWTSSGQVEWINRSEARDVRFTFVRRTEDGESHFAVTDGTLDYWTERPCRAYVSPVTRTALASASLVGPIPTYPTGTHLIVADQAPVGASEPAARWYRGYAQVAALPRWDAFCPTSGRPPSPPYQWSTGWILMWTNVGATFGAWTPSPSANRLEGTVTGVSGGPVYRLTWRLERVID